MDDRNFLGIVDNEAVLSLRHPVDRAYTRTLVCSVSGEDHCLYLQQRFEAANERGEGTETGKDCLLIQFTA